MKAGDDTAHVVKGQFVPNANVPSNVVSAFEGKRGQNGLPVSKDDTAKPILASETQHVVCQDSGWEAGFHLATAIDNAFILGYALLVMSFLGWAAGATLFIVGGIATLYCNIKLATLAVIDGVRFTRFRDISNAVYGKWALWLTIICQWINIIGGNIGLLILAGQALKGIHDLYTDNQNIQLAHWVIVAAVCAWLFTMGVPHLHNLRLWSGIACACTIAFVAIVVGVSIHDGMHWDTYAANNPFIGPGVPRTYTVQGSTAGKAFDAMGALSTIAFAYTAVINPEIQATVRDPPVQEFYKSLAVTYGIGAPIFLIMSMVGYWAYGDTVAPNLISNLSGPDWAKTIAYLGVFVQTIVSFQVYGSPIFEFFDTHYAPWKLWALKSVMFRFVYRTIFVAFCAFVAAILPFFGDVVALIGALSVLPLSFVLVLLMYVKVNRAHMSTLHIFFDWFLAVLFSLICVGSTIASIRYIVVDSINYSAFANIS